jgi:hypothetical protein
VAGALETEEEGWPAGPLDEPVAFPAETSAEAADVASEAGPIELGGREAVVAAPSGGDAYGTRALRLEDLQLAAAARQPPAAPAPLAAEAPAFAVGEDVLGSGADEQPLAEPAPFGDEAALGAAPWPEPAGGDDDMAPIEAEASEPDLTSKTLGLLYLQQGNRDKAGEILGRYLAAHPDDAEVRAKLQASTAIRPEATPAVVAPPAPAADRGTSGAEDEKRKKIQKLSSWLSSLRKH